MTDDAEPANAPEGEQRGSDASATVVVTDYHHRAEQPYRCCLHDAHDHGVDQHRLIERLSELAGAVDGDEIEISIRLTGRRPFGDEKVRLVAPGKYLRAPKSEELA